jgi:hypothetical protein
MLLSRLDVSISAMGGAFQQSARQFVGSRQAAIRLRLFRRTHLRHTYPVQYYTFPLKGLDIGKSATLELAGGGEKGMPFIVNLLARS